MKMKTVKGRVTETIVVDKVVECEVPDDFTDDQIRDAIRKKSYDKIIGEPESGWELVETVNADVYSIFEVSRRVSRPGESKARPRRR